MTATQVYQRPGVLVRTARRDLKAALRRADLLCSGLDCFIPTEHFLASETADRAVHAVVSAIGLAEDLGRIPVCLNLPTEEDLKKAAGHVVGEAIAAAADRCGIEVADHTIPVATREGIGVGIDPAAYIAVGEAPDEAIMKHAGSIVSCRLSDLLTTGMRGPIGLRTEGRLDVLRYKVALSVAGYQRPIVIDARQWLKPWDGVEHTKSWWERTLTLP